MSNPADFQPFITWAVAAIAAESSLDAVSGTYMYSAPEKGINSFPYVVVGKQSGTHTYTMCRQAFATHYLAIKCVDTGFDGGNRARTLMGKVVDLLELQTPTLSGGLSVLSITANNSYEYDEQESGNRNFFHCIINFKVVIGRTV